QGAVEKNIAYMHACSMFHSTARERHGHNAHLIPWIGAIQVYKIHQAGIQVVQCAQGSEGIRRQAGNLDRNALVGTIYSSVRRHSKSGYICKDGFVDGPMPGSFSIAVIAHAV